MLFEEKEKNLLLELETAVKDYLRRYKQSSPTDMAQIIIDLDVLRRENRNGHLDKS